jgi:DNA topoisomerase-3
VKVVLAEKPSVARDLASFLKADSRHDGYFQGGGYQVTWALGHLVGLKEPGDYDRALKKWSLDTLPFVPQTFELKLRGDKRARDQFTVVKRLLKSADQLICATDAGREGELIFRYILELAGCTHKSAQRLWLNSLTPQAIRQAFRSMQPLADYDNLYAAAKCRSESDWIVGLNATRNYTVRFGSAGILLSLGRVQTPVLAMIVHRDDEIQTFKPQPFWELMTTYRKTCFRHSGDRFDKQQDAQTLLDHVQSHAFVIQQVDSKPEKSLPPQLYDLTELQRDMNRRFGISAADTLQSAQALYERKLITYPRSDSRYLSTDMKAEVPGILRRLRSFKPDEIGKLHTARGFEPRFSKPTTDNRPGVDRSSEAL